jgi:putative selenate reductase
MAELVPIPLDLQLRRAFTEYEREGKIFDLPRYRFFRGLEGLDLSAVSNGHRAFTPLGPAAGPHTQLLPNIVLSWLAGGRIIELKTVQVLDELKIPRPCIDSETVTYNVEWSQELKLEHSLREYVSAAMFLTILKESKLLGEELPPGFFDTILDMSAGYNLEGIRSPRMRAWIEGMKNASATINELRTTLTGRFRQFRDLPFPETVSDSMTLSTFHGCPAEEIEGIVSFLLSEMDVDVCVKMNPTLLGREQVRFLLHDVLGYSDIVLDDEAFERDLKFDEAVDVTAGLQALARAHDRQFSVKFSNTLVVRNHRRVFSDERMYMSGPPLHVITLNLVKKFRERMGAGVPLSFSAGLTANNVAHTAAMNFVPLTTCSDLLREGGYARLPRYLNNLGAEMRAAGATTLNEFVVRHAGVGSAALDRTCAELRHTLRPMEDDVELPSRQAAESWLKYVLDPGLRAWLHEPRTTLRETCELVTGKLMQMAITIPEELTIRFAAELAVLEQKLVDNAALLNTTVLVEQATIDPRYQQKHNQAPRKTTSQLALFDCIACDKCVPACPNDANFVYETPAVEIAYENYELLPDGTIQEVAGGTFRIARRHQVANYADACNNCGNCDVFCPEHGGPQWQKPRFFGSLETYRKHAGDNGFCIVFGADCRTIHGKVAGRQCQLTIANDASDCARFEDEFGEYVIQPSAHRVVSWRPKQAQARRFDMLCYLQLKLLLDAVGDTRRVNFANVVAVES